MKKLVSVMVVFSVCCTAFAMPMEYNGISVEVDSLVGTGSNQTMIVVDWETGLTPSHAWLYQYDGTKFVADALDAIVAVSSFEWSQNAYVEFMNYDDGAEVHQTLNFGWLSFWNKDGGDWQWNGYGVYEQELVNGSWSGIIADDPVWGDIAPTIPQIPEPATMLLIAVGAFLARRKK